MRTILDYYKLTQIFQPGSSGSALRQCSASAAANQRHSQHYFLPYPLSPLFSSLFPPPLYQSTGA
jgi:hypothetical protein